MGLMRLKVSPADRINSLMADQAYLTGLDRVPWETRATQADDLLVVERAISESASLHVPWVTDDYGLLCISTATLLERQEPYRLPLELARGKLAQLRNQLADWQMIGLDVPPQITETLAEAMRAFGHAATGDRLAAESAAAADRALNTAVTAAYHLAAAFSEQLLSVRRRSSGKLRTFLGANLGVSLLDDYLASQYAQAFNAACIPMVWREIETGEGKYYWDVIDQQIQWCRSRGMGIVAGPLIQLDRRSIPDWLYLWQDNFEGLADFASEFIEAVVTRYRGSIDVWVAGGRVNTADVFGLTEEERLRLTARTVELIRTHDALADMILSFDQPWGEYLRREGQQFPPVHLADELLRAGLGLTGLGLEINLGYSPGASLPRDPLEFNRLLDYWSMLNVPLHLFLSVPSGSQPDPMAQRQCPEIPGLTSPGHQQAWVGRYLPMLLAKPNVHGVFWNQLRDSEPHEFPHAGLFDLRRHPKPALRQLASLRQAHLK